MTAITCSKIIQLYTQNLCAIGLSNQEAQQEIWWMLEKITQKKKASLLANNIHIESKNISEIKNWIHERTITRKPLAYILGSLPFANIDILVESPILIPRPETEEWVIWLIEQLKSIGTETLSILDLCTGTGCIALTLAKNFPKANVIGVDINEKAIDLANKNKIYNNISNATFLQSNLFDDLKSTDMFDLIVANPPYITMQEYVTLEPEIKNWEDKNALIAENNGLIFYQRIARDSQHYLNNHSILNIKELPQIICEIGTNFEEVKNIFSNSFFKNTQLYQDMYGTQRWISIWTF